MGYKFPIDFLRGGICLVIRRRVRFVLFSLLLPKREFLPCGGLLPILLGWGRCRFVRPGSKDFLRGSKGRFGRFQGGGGGRR